MVEDYIEATMAELPIIVRPNGRTYRPRKIIAYAWAGYDDYGVIVFGTHDVERAEPLALDACRSWFGASGVTAPRNVWFRDGRVNGERCWFPDEERGRPGVMFEASDNAEEASDG